MYHIRLYHIRLSYKYIYIILNIIYYQIHQRCLLYLPSGHLIIWRVFSTSKALLFRRRYSAMQPGGPGNPKKSDDVERSWSGLQTLQTSFGINWDPVEIQLFSGNLLLFMLNSWDFCAKVPDSNQKMPIRTMQHGGIQKCTLQSDRSEFQLFTSIGPSWNGLFCDRTLLQNIQ